MIIKYYLLFIESKIHWRKRGWSLVEETCDKHSKQSQLYSLLLPPYLYHPLLLEYEFYFYLFLKNFLFFMNFPFDTRANFSIFPPIAAFFCVWYIIKKHKQIMGRVMDVTMNTVWCVVDWSHLMENVLLFSRTTSHTLIKINSIHQMCVTMKDGGKS